VRFALYCADLTQGHFWSVAQMSEAIKPQRIRDPLHNLIEFDTEQLERVLWQVIQTPPFQRLRRIRQLGFCEFVFPGATHTRFAHSVGVFHTARQLMRIIRQHSGKERFQTQQANAALAASLVHDVGHGMFSHSFEEIGKTLDLPMAKHEEVSEQLIRNSEISECFGELGSGFANDVANILARSEPRNLYDSVVSSQFDADRLDYMQRDRLMTGVQSSGIDATWLINNLEVGTIQITSDDETSGSANTLVLGPKAFHAAENYVLSLFQLYPNVYLHKTIRSAEKVFSNLMLRIFELNRTGHKGKIGLPSTHPIRRFADEPTSLLSALRLDDFVFWGSLPMLVESPDPLIRQSAIQLRERRLPKCIDVRRYLEQFDPIAPDMDNEARREREARIRLKCKEITRKIQEESDQRNPSDPQILLDEVRRSPYKKFGESKTRLNQILIRQGDGHFEDMAHLSPVVASAETFEATRIYYNADDTDGLSMIQNIIGTHGEGGDHGGV